MTIHKEQRTQCVIRRPAYRLEFFVLDPAESFSAVARLILTINTFICLKFAGNTCIFRGVKSVSIKK